MSHIKYMGIELEGLWYELRDDQENSFKGDGSLSFNNNNCICCSNECECDVHDHGMDDDGDHNSENCRCCEGLCSCVEYHVDDHECSEGKKGSVGEIPSPALKPLELCKWIDENYPDETNKTCGAHIHISFNSLIDYARLLEKDFHNYFLDKMIVFGKMNKIKDGSEFWRRLEGRNTYCSKKFDPDKQLIQDGDRYTQLNACAFLTYGTLEIRLMPCFRKKHLTQNAVYFIYTMIEKYLDKVKKRERANKIKVLAV